MIMYAVVSADGKMIHAVSPIAGADMVPADLISELVHKEADEKLETWVLEAPFFVQLIPVKEWAEAICTHYPGTMVMPVELKL